MASHVGMRAVQPQEFSPVFGHIAHAGFTLTLARNIMDMPALSPAATLFMIGQMITATLVMLVLIEIFPKLFDFKRKKHEKSR